LPAAAETSRRAQEVDRMPAAAETSRRAQEVDRIVLIFSSFHSK
jgi:hypothetical protein